VPRQSLRLALWENLNTLPLTALHEAR